MCDGVTAPDGGGSPEVAGQLPPLVHKLLRTHGQHLLHQLRPLAYERRQAVGASAIVARRCIRLRAIAGRLHHQGQPAVLIGRLLLLLLLGRWRGSQLLLLVLLLNVQLYRRLRVAGRLLHEGEGHAHCLHSVQGGTVCVYVCVWWWRVYGGGGWGCVGVRVGVGGQPRLLGRRAACKGSQMVPDGAVAGMRSGRVQSRAAD